MNALHISKGLDLPMETVTDTIGVLAIKGAGKTYTFLKMAEEMVKAGLPVAIVDVVGVCWGLRLGADGKSKGLDVVIFGGDHADVPLHEGSGELVAEWILNERRSCVIDVSGFETKASLQRFALSFLTHLYQKAKREPVHVILDEADEFAPQRPFGEEARLLRAVEVLVRRGRAKGIGVSLVTQRPAVISKNVLTQISTLIVGRTLSPQDRKAVDEWVSAHATGEQRKAFMASLASLSTKEKWVWSPARNVMGCAVIEARETFDSSSTPKVGDKRPKPAKIAPLDMAALRERMEAFDVSPKAREEVRRRVTELEAPPVQVRVVYDGDLVNRLDGVAEELLRLHGSVGAKLIEVRALLQAAKAKVGTDASAEIVHATIANSVPTADPHVRKVVPMTRGPRGDVIVTPVRKPKGSTVGFIGDQKLGRCELAILGVLAARSPERTTSAPEIAALSGYSVTSSGFENSLSSLRSKELIVGGRRAMGITDRGWKFVSPANLLRGTALLAQVEKNLSTCERAILRAVYRLAKPMSKEEIAAAATRGDGTAYSPNSSGFENSLSHLRTLELLAGYRGEIRLGPALENII